jgi:hypothetical protein
MRPKPLWTCIVATGVLAVTPAWASAAMSEVLGVKPHVDLAVELEYRTRFLSPDHQLRDEAPPDRIGRERLDDARERVAREYVRRLTDAVADEMLDSLPFISGLERRYDRATTYRLDRTRPAPAAATDGASAAGPSDESGPRLELPAARATDVSTTVRFRLGRGLTLRPGLELIRGRLRARLHYGLASQRAELVVAREVLGNVSLELVGSEGLDRTGSEVRLGLRIPF